MSYAAVSELRRLPDFDDAWQVSSAGPRLRAVRAAAERLREKMASGPRALAVRTLPLATLLYPTKYAFWTAAWNPSPYVVMTHRCLLVQFLQRGEPKTLLFNPTDVIAARETPYFKKRVEQMGDFLAFSVLTTTYEPIETQLAHYGLSPSDIDYVAFDHFHTQDVRPLLGTEDGSYLARFPRAKLLAPKSEWNAWDDVHPIQKAWFQADGKRNVRADRVALTDGDLELGDGVWIFRTPGHTVGNQTLFVSTDGGIWGSSENGTCADAWSPLESRIQGLRQAAKHQDVDVILNANTPELMADQVTSMVLERTLVDRVKRAPAFCQMLSSSEVTPSWIAPGVKPTILHRQVTHGTVVAEIPATRRAPSFQHAAHGAAE